MKRFFFALLLTANCFFWGCDEGVVTTSGPAEPASSASSEPKQADKASSPAAPEADVLKKADVGATGKGKFADSAEKPMSIVTVPLATYFRAQEMAVFRIQIPQALKLFNGTNGRNPESQEEFMSQIIRANNLVLPQLPPGDSYVYDVPSATLMIKTKK